jgi:CcmD family protein
MVNVQGGFRSSGRRKVVWGQRAIIVALLLLTVMAVAPLMRVQQPQTPAAQEGFVPAKDLPSPQDQVPAAPLVMIAYAVAWAAILIYVWSIWQRLNRVQQEIAAVSRRVEGGARR